MNDVPYIKDFLTCLIAKHKRKCVFLFELLPCAAPDHLLYTGEDSPILMPLDESEVDENFKTYGCSWSRTAADKGINWQLPFIDENFSVRQCFYTLSDKASPLKFDKHDKPPGGDHKRNDMLLDLALEKNIETFAIDLPGADFAMMKVGGLENVRYCQRFDYWNLLRDAWMSKLIARTCRDQPEAIICAFVGADHMPGLEHGQLQREFRFAVDHLPKRREVTVSNYFCLDQTDFKDAVIYLEPLDYSEGRKTFGLKELGGKWKY
jgi:hypothetical protein